MLTPMVERVFLGWDRPFLLPVTDWLLARREVLPRLLIVVPTSHGGRRLGDALAAQGGGLLALQITTPGALLKTPDPQVAADWMERVAWLETLEAVTEWQDYQEFLPQSPRVGEHWADGLAQELVNLRHALQDNGLTLAAAARLLARSVEAGRWAALERLENLMERKLRTWGLQSRSQVLAGGVVLPSDLAGIVLVGVTEMPAMLERALAAWPGPVTALISALESTAHMFSNNGKPLDCWAANILPWPTAPTGEVHLVADSRQQAVVAVQAVTSRQTAVNEVALGCADTTTGDELARAFTRAGWPAFHPASAGAITGLRRWLSVWSAWLDDPKLATLADLLAMPATAMLVTGCRAEHAECLSRLRNDWMVMRPADLRQRIATSNWRTPAQRQAALALLEATQVLETWRMDFLRGDFTATMTRLLEVLGHQQTAAAEETTAIYAWLAVVAPMLRQVPRGPGFWLGLLLAAVPAPAPQPPPDRVIDVHGWLELLLEPGHHLVLCGMNEGHVPACSGGDPWLGEAARQHLGLAVNADRAARDAFLYQALLEARIVGGRVDVISAKAGADGEALLPSRLLLAAARDDLPARVQFLFRGIEPPEAGLRWHADWQWQPRIIAAPQRISVTSLATYLACPLRYYLKHVVGMQNSDADRVEWNARDFGTVAHEIMERWGRDPEARALTDPTTLHAWLTAELDRVVAEWFGNHVPLAVLVQAAALRQRLAWLARVQAAECAAGWEVSEVEYKFEIPIGAATVVAKIDRIDRHREHGTLRVIDYKTGKVEGVDKAHRRKMTARTLLPDHLTIDSPAVYHGAANGKPCDFVWSNLQLPLYAMAVRERLASLPVPAYFTLGATEADVAIHEWTDFASHDLEAASACASWLVAQITSGVFWPPAEHVRYDDFTGLAAGRTLQEMCRMANV